MGLVAPLLSLLTPEGAWIQGAFARNTRTGRTIGPEEADAGCWCLVGGALRTSLGHRHRGMLYSYIRQAIQELFPGRIEPPQGIPAFNDHPDTTHADVLRVLERARELEEAAA